MTDTAAPSSLSSLLMGLVDGLSSSGAVPPDWRAAFLAVPRHLFVPDLVWRDREDGSGPQPVRRTEQPDTWLQMVYRDEPIITQINDGAPPAASPDSTAVRHTFYTSSTNMPTVVAEMLTALRAEPGMSVLEIGTGTGWNTALLAHRLGGEHVTSIEIDPHLSAHAQQALADAIPWVPISDIVTEDSEASAEEKLSKRHPRYYVAGYDVRTAIGVQVPRCIARYTPPDADDPDGILWLLDQWSHSWAAVHHQPDQPGPYRVRQYGPRRLFDEVSAAYRGWKAAGTPQHTPGASPSHQRASEPNSTESGIPWGRQRAEHRRDRRDARREGCGSSLLRDAWRTLSPASLLTWHRVPLRNPANSATA